MASAIMAGAADLTAKETAIVDIGAWTARGEQDKLGAAFKTGFNAGLTLNEAKELVGQLYAYCGFPRALNAAATLMGVWGRGNGEWKTGKTPSPFPDGYNALRDGEANQTKLCGAPVKGPLFEFHPQLDEYLKAHLFGDIFQRDNLDWKTRELVTIAALAARPETEPQLKAHIQVGKVNGISDEQASAIVRRVQRSSTQARIQRNREAMKLFEKCINTNDLELGKKLISEKAAFKTPVSPKPLMGAEGYLSVVTLMRKSFPDVQWKLEDMVADEHTVAVEWTCSGTFTGSESFAGVQPNGRKFSTTVMNFYKFDDDGMIIDDIAATGIAGILQGIEAK